MYISIIGARLIYAEVLRLRGLNPDRTDPTRSFLVWSKLLSPNIDSSSFKVPDLVIPDSIPLLQPNQLILPSPSPSLVTSNHYDLDEPEYGPGYVPYVAQPIELVH